MTSYSFDGFHFDTVGETLSRDGHTQRLRPQTARLLTYFLDQRGQIITKEMLAENVWGDAVVNDQAIFQCINQLRKALEEAPRQPRYLKTVPRQGYQWIFEPVSSKGTDVGPSLPPPEADTASFPTQVPSRRSRHGGRSRPNRLFFVSGLVILVALLGWLAKAVLNPNDEAATDTGIQATPLRVAVLPFSNQTGDPTKQWVELGLMDMVIRQFRGHQGLEPVSTERILKAIDDMRILRQAAVKPANARRLLNVTGTDWVIAVTVRSTGGRFAAEIAAWSLTGSHQTKRIDDESPANMGFRVGHEVAALLKRETVGEFMHALSDNPYVNESFAQGIQALHQGEEARAEAYFEICTLEDPDFLWGVYHLAGCRWALGRIQEARTLLLDLLNRAIEQGDAMLEADVHTLLGDMNEESGDYGSAEVNYRKALLLLREDGDREAELAALLDLGFCLDHDGRGEESAAAYGEALKLARATGDRLGEASVRNMQALSAMQQGRDEEARLLLQETLQHYRDLNSPLNEAFTLINLGAVHYYDDRFEEAIQAYERALNIFRIEKLPVGEAQTLMALGELFVYLRRWERAGDTLTRALEIVERLGNPRDAFDVHLALAEMGSRTDDESLVEAHGGAMEALAGQLDLPVQQAEKDAYFAFHHLRHGRPNVAEPFMERVMAYHASTVYPPAILIRARYAYASGDYRAAYNFQREVKESYEGIWDREEEDLLNAYAEAAQQNSAVDLPPH